MLKFNLIFIIFFFSCHMTDLMDIVCSVCSNIKKFGSLYYLKIGFMYVIIAV